MLFDKLNEISTQHSKGKEHLNYNELKFVKLIEIEMNTVAKRGSFVCYYNIHKDKTVDADKIRNYFLSQGIVSSYKDVPCILELGVNHRFKFSWR